MNDERVFICTGCRRPIAVGPYYDDIDPATYLGYVCGCRQFKTEPEPEPEPVLEPAQTLGAAMERAQAAQTGHGIPYRQEA